MEIKKSRGVVSHVGVVLSFVIFVTLVIFIYIIAKPAVDLENKQNQLDNLKTIIIENSSADLSSASVFIGVFSQTCVQLNNFFDKVEGGEKIVVRNEFGEVLNAKISGQDLYVEKNAGEIFLKVYSSEEFDITETGTMSGCKLLNEGPQGYVLGLVRTEKNIFEKKIIQLIGTTSGDDFSINFTYANKTSIATKVKEIQTSVFIDESSIQYISKNAAREAGSLKIGVW